MSFQVGCQPENEKKWRWIVRILWSKKNVSFFFRKESYAFFSEIFCWDDLWHWIYDLSRDIDRFRNYPGFRNYDSETKIQKLFRPIQKLRFGNYSRRIQKLFSTDSETIWTDSETISTDSETILDRFRHYCRRIQKLFSNDFRNQIQPIQKLRFRNYVRPIQKLFWTESETICRPIQTLWSTDSETKIVDRFRNYCATNSETIFDRFRNYFRPIQKLFSTDSETTIELVWIVLLVCCLSLCLGCCLWTFVCLFVAVPSRGWAASPILTESVESKIDIFWLRNVSF